MKRFDDLFNVKMADLPENFKNCFLLSMGRFYQAKNLSNNRGLDLLSEIKKEYVVSQNYVKDEIHDQLFLKINQNAQVKINQHTLKMLIVQQITLEEILYLQAVAKLIYIFQLIRLPNGEEFSHHEVCFPEKIMETELHDNASITYFHVLD